MTPGWWKQRSAERNLRGWCANCTRVPEVSKKYCVICAEKNRRNAKAGRAKLVKENRCITCGKANDTKVLRCTVCSAYVNKQSRLYLQRKKGCVLSAPCE